MFNDKAFSIIVKEFTPSNILGPLRFRDTIEERQVE